MTEHERGCRAYHSCYHTCLYNSSVSARGAEHIVWVLCIMEACRHCLSCCCMQVSLGEQALQKATEHLKATIVSTSSLEGRIHTEAPGQQKAAPLPMHDTSMGTLEHRLEGEVEDSGAEQMPDGEGMSQVADYNAWVHGSAGESPAEAPTAGSTSRLAKPSD